MSINQTLTFGPTDTSKVISFNISDDEVPSESTEQFEIFLNGTHERYNILFDPNEKTTINILDDGMYFMRFSIGLKTRSSPIVQKSIFIYNNVQ